MDFTLILIIYLATINIAGFAFMGIDKRRASHRQWRIPERIFVLMAVFGASAGIICGMGVFHHKTKHTKFCIGIPVIFLFQLAAVYFITSK